jgi:hypothetical protein
MKRIFNIIILIVAGCTNDKNNQPSATHHSRAESAINILVDSFRSEYTSAKSIAARDVVMSEYQEKTEKYLSGHYLNHMRVHVDSVIIKNLTIDTKFHDGRNLVFISSMEFRRHMPKTEDTLYHFMKSLQQGTDTNIDFMYIGKFELHPPNDSLHPTLVMNAYPLSYQVHGKR